MEYDQFSHSHALAELLSTCPYRSSPSAPGYHRPSIILQHTPDFVTQSEENKMNLQISGHYHGGWSWPINLFMALRTTRVHGLYRISDDTQIYVTSGARRWSTPLRLGIPPEVAVLTIRRG
jgi:predicted MPP superfamily phosphohydrolase